MPPPTPTAFDAYKQTQHFGALDGMRAIGVVLVIFDHYGGEHLKFLSGWLGVHVFFVMSGFLITTLLLREQEKRGQVSLTAFYVRRCFRILPVYYLILLIVTIQTKALGGLIFADVLYRYVEQPFISFGKRILQSRNFSSSKLNSPITSSA